MAPEDESDSPFDFALEMIYFETKFKEKVQEVSKILKSLQKVPDPKLSGV